MPSRQRDSRESPRFSQPATFMRLPYQTDLAGVDGALLGVEPASGRTEPAVARILSAGVVPIVVGGDHSISLPVLRAIARQHGPVALGQFDAHIDAWGDYFGGKYFHGSPFRRAI